MQLFRYLVVLVVIGWVFPSASVIIEIKKVGDKTIECMHSGLHSDLKDCGLRSDWYEYVFVGSITAITPIEKDEFELKLTPEEIFHGSVPNPLTVRTDQGLCLPPLKVGDRWLFMLRKAEGKGVVFDYYGNDSLPIADAQKEIETFRRLQTIGDYAIFRGSVVDTRDPSESKRVANARVIARSAVDKEQFVAITDAEGRYEFPPLPPGKYDLKVDPVGSFQPDPSWIELSAGQCRDLAVTKEQHARVTGHVRSADGSPVADLQVVLIEKEGFSVQRTDAQGRFHYDGLRAGEYRVGINLPRAPLWKDEGCGGAGCGAPSAPLYYPGARSLSDAGLIFLSEDEKRDDINFVVK